MLRRAVRRWPNSPTRSQNVHRMAPNQVCRSWLTVTHAYPLLRSRTTPTSTYCRLTSCNSAPNPMSTFVSVGHTSTIAKSRRRHVPPPPSSVRFLFAYAPFILMAHENMSTQPVPWEGCSTSVSREGQGTGSSSHGRTSIVTTWHGCASSWSGMRVRRHKVV